MYSLIIFVLKNIAVNIVLIDSDYMRLTDRACFNLVLSASFSYCSSLHWSVHSAHCWSDSSHCLRHSSWFITNSRNSANTAQHHQYLYLTVPYLTSGVGRLLHLPSVEAVIPVSHKPNAQPWCHTNRLWSQVSAEKPKPCWRLCHLCIRNKWVLKPVSIPADNTVRQRTKSSYSATNDRRLILVKSAQWPIVKSAQCQSANWYNMQMSDHVHTNSRLHYFKISYINSCDSLVISRVS